MFIYLFMFIFLLLVYIEFVFGMHNTCISAGLKQKKTSSIYSLLYFCRLAKSFIVVFMLSVSSSKNIYTMWPKKHCWPILRFDWRERVGVSEKEKKFAEENNENQIFGITYKWMESIEYIAEYYFASEFLAFSNRKIAREWVSWIFY